MQRKDWPSAAAALREFTMIVPHSTRAWIELSYVESFQGHYRAAAEAAAAARHLPGRTTADASDLIARLRTFNDGCGVRELSRTVLQAPSALTRRSGAMNLRMGFSCFFRVLGRVCDRSRGRNGCFSLVFR